MSTTPTDGDDVLTGTKGADIIDGGEGDDIINSGAGDDIISGGEGNDQLHAGAGDDCLEGGAGNDFLNGGGGSDTYKFNFTVNSSGGVPIPFPGFDAGTDGALSQGEFSSQYTAWLQSLGTDGADAGNTVDVALNQNDSVLPPEVEGFDGEFSAKEAITLSNGAERYYSESATPSGGAPVITDDDGYDTIAQFQNSGPNVDKIVMNGLAGLTDEQLDNLFDLTASDINGDGDIDTVLSWEGGSITILGTSEWGDDVLAFFNDDRVFLT